MKKLLFCSIQGVRLMTVLSVLFWLPLTSFASSLIYTIQTGSFVHEADAQKQFDSLKQGLREKDLGHLRIEKIGNYYSVRIGNYENQDTAEKHLQAISPLLSAALIMKAYIKDERIKKIYGGYLSFDKPEVAEKVSSDIEPVKAAVLENDQPASQTSTGMYSAASPLIYTIQTGSFVHEADAQKQFDSLKQGLREKDLGHLRIEKIGNYYSVRIGNYENQDTAEKHLQAISPHLSAALITKAYIKDERIKKIYGGYLSFDKPEVAEKVSSDIEPVKAAVLENDQPASQTSTGMYSAASPLFDKPEVEENSSSDFEPGQAALSENEKQVKQVEAEMHSADHKNSEPMYAMNDHDVLETNEYESPATADLSLDLDGLDIEDDAQEYTFPEIKSEAAVFAGYRFIEHGGSKRALEYEYMKNHPVFGGKWRSFKYPNTMHFDFDFKNNKDYEADFRYAFKSMVNFRWFNSTLFHNLDNIELLDFNPSNSTYIVDNRNVGEEYGVKVAFNRIDLNLKPLNYPFHLYFNGFHRRRSGEQQQRSLQGNAYHNNIVRTTQNRDVDWRTKDFVVGANIHLGIIETDISHREKRFDVGGDPQLIDPYLSGGGRPAGTYPHNLIPELASTSNTIKIHTSLTGKLVTSASLTKKDGWNRDSGASTDILHGTGAVTYRPLTNLSFFAKYAHRELDRINPSSVSITDFATGSKVTYTDLRPSISSTSDTVSLTGKYKPVPKVTLRAKYYHKQKERGNAELWDLADEVSRKNEITFFASTRLIKTTEIKADYTHGWASDPLYNVEPNRLERGSISVSWIPSYRMNFLVSYRKAQEDRSGLGYVDTEEPESRETRSDNAFASGTFLIVENLSLTTSYAYMRYKIIQDIETHSASGVALTDFDVPMEERTQVFSASLNYVPVESLRLLAEINHSESHSEFDPNHPNLIEPESLSVYSMQKIRETDYRVSGDFDCINNGSCVIEFQYSNFDDVIDNINDDNEDGNAYIVYLKYMKRWQ